MAKKKQKSKNATAKKTTTKKVAKPSKVKKNVAKPADKKAGKKAGKTAAKKVGGVKAPGPKGVAKSAGAKPAPKKGLPNKAAAKPVTKKVIAKKAEKKDPKKTDALAVSKKLTPQTEPVAIKKAVKTASSPASPKAIKKADKPIGKKTDNKLEDKATKKSVKSQQPEGAEEVALTGPVGVNVDAIKIQKEVVLTDAEGRVLCRIRDCDQPAVVESYCRYHYLLYWRKIQSRKRILNEGKLEKYIEELTTRFPVKYLDMLKRDLSSESDFLNAIQELEIDESVGDDSGDFEDDQTFIEEVRGISDQSDRDESEY